MVKKNNNFAILAVAGITAIFLLTKQTSADTATSSSGDTGYTGFNDALGKAGSGETYVTNYNVPAPNFPEVSIPQAIIPTSPINYATGQSIDTSISKKQVSSGYGATSAPRLAYVNPSIGYENPYTQQSVQYPTKKQNTVTQNPYSNPQSIDPRNTYKVK